MRSLIFLSFLLLFQTLPLHGAEIYVHMMPWFETKETNNGTWGQHWTMANRNPDNIVDGVPEIASFYHPEIGPYASGDPDVIDWQLGHMKAAGISGIFLDWPGTTDAYEYAKNKENAEAIIEGTKRAGLKFAVVYEDNNLNLAAVPDKIAQGQADMEYLQSNYFTEDNYLQVKDAPLLLDFGPQALHDAEWDEVLEPLDPKATFVTL
ncbi:glycoprotein endo-alpha-1,2-mannosidase-like [Zophobas morio]|uniref:glycoprotein endo-alpha-1,2-mannosidase-like n=1 Tax=Zophobas morio TaxID=2755281 RepID=UPI00308291B5